MPARAHCVRRERRLRRRVPAATDDGAWRRRLRRGSRTPRPNIVVVMLDDFSMDLVQTMRSVQRMRQGGRVATRTPSSPTRCAACRGRASSPGQYPHQTGVLTNTSNQGTSMLGGWPAYDTNGNPERAFNVRLQEAGYTTGFVGKFLNEYEWSPGRALPPVVPGWSTFNTVFGSAYDGWDFASTSVVDQRMRLHPARRAARERERPREGQGVRRHGDRRPGDGLPRARARPRTRRTSSRSSLYAPAQPHAARGPLPRRPAVPADVPRPRGRAGLRAGGVPQADRRRPAGLRRPARRQPPAHARGKPARAWNTVPTLSPPRSPSATCATARGWRSPPTG